MLADHERMAADLGEAVAVVKASRATIVDEDAEDHLAGSRAARGGDRPRHQRVADTGALPAGEQVELVQLDRRRRPVAGKQHRAEQGEWLVRLGIDSRAAALARAAPERTAMLAADRERLVRGMGALFKVLAVTAPGWPAPAGFA